MIKNDDCENEHLRFISQLYDENKEFEVDDEQDLELEGEVKDIEAEIQNYLSKNLYGKLKNAQSHDKKADLFSKKKLDKLIYNKLIEQKQAHIDKLIYKNLIEKKKAHIAFKKEEKSFKRGLTKRQKSIFYGED